jgi:hypothetical protein
MSEVSVIREMCKVVSYSNRFNGQQVGPSQPARGSRSINVHTITATCLNIR